MKKISVSDIQDGMVIAQPVIGSSGNVLIGAGSSLHANMASRLANWGISTLFIESPENEAPTVNVVTVDHGAQESLDALFQGRLVNSAMRTIYQCLLQHRGSGNA